MTEAVVTPTPQAPAAAQPASPAPAPAAAPAPAPAPAAAVPTPGDPAPVPNPDDFKSPESKAAVLADLAKAREATAALKAQFETQNKALAAALGLEQAPKSEDLAETVKALQSQFAASQLEATKLRIAAEKQIPAEYHDLLTETDTEKLTAQATRVAELVAAKATAEGTPAFQPNPGQGQGTPLTPEAQQAAEYLTYYPSKSK